MGDERVFYCPRAKSDMTPCVGKDGRLAEADDGACVACGVFAADELKSLVPRYVDQKEALEEAQAKIAAAKSFIEIDRIHVTGHVEGVDCALCDVLAILEGTGK